MRPNTIIILKISAVVLNFLTDYCAPKETFKPAIIFCSLKLSFFVFFFLISCSVRTAPSNLALDKPKSDLAQETNYYALQLEVPKKVKTISVTYFCGDKSVSFDLGNDDFSQEEEQLTALIPNNCGFKPLRNLQLTLYYVDGSSENLDQGNFY